MDYALILNVRKLELNFPCWQGGGAYNLLYWDIHIPHKNIWNIKLVIPRQGYIPETKENKHYFHDSYLIQYIDF